MKKQMTVTIPAEVWEMSMKDAEKLAKVHQECVRLAFEVERLNKELKQEKAHRALDLLHLQRGIIALQPNDEDFNDVNEWIKVGRKVCNARKAKKARESK